MKSLLDIQKDVKELEGIVRDAANALDEISRDIQEVRSSDGDMDMDYDIICTMASNIPFENHPLDDLEDGYVCKIYIELLLCLIRLDGNGVVEKLTFVQWILNKARLDITLQDAYLESMELGKEIYAEFGRLIPGDYKSQFVLDMLLVANFTGMANAESTAYIANLCAILDIEAKKVRRYSAIAKVILCQDVRSIKKADLKECEQYFKMFKNYIGKVLPRNALGIFRTIAVEVPDSDINGNSIPFKWKVAQGSYVKKGEAVAVYKEAGGYLTPGKKVEIKAKCSGTLYQFRDKCVNYGVISDASDNKDSIKAWAQQRGNGK